VDERKGCARLAEAKYLIKYDEIKVDEIKANLLGSRGFEI